MMDGTEQVRPLTRLTDDWSLPADLPSAGISCLRIIVERSKVLLHQPPITRLLAAFRGAAPRSVSGLLDIAMPFEQGNYELPLGYSCSRAFPIKLLFRASAHPSELSAGIEV